MNFHVKNSKIMLFRCFIARQTTVVCDCMVVIRCVLLRVRKTFFFVFSSASSYAHSIRIDFHMSRVTCHLEMSTWLTELWRIKTPNRKSCWSASLIRSTQREKESYICVVTHDTLDEGWEPFGQSHCEKIVKLNSKVIFLFCVSLFVIFTCYLIAYVLCVF